MVGLFDSVYVSFYKGLNATTGALIAGEAAFVGRARAWAKTLDAIPFSNSANALSCHMQLQQRIKPGWGQLPASEAANVFIPLYARLGQLRVTLQSLSAADVAADAAGRQRLLRVDRPSPEPLGSAMMHVYIWSGVESATASEELGQLEAHHHAAQTQTGVRLWNRLRGTGHTKNNEHYF
eukprot:COSAG05_NODE_2149_length_3474_cov_2.524444_2_plen_180_part_00